MAAQFGSIDEYIGSFPEDVQEILQEVRRRIHGAAPGGTEKIGYNIAEITLNDKRSVYFAGWKSHISLYPAPGGDEALAAELAPYLTDKSTLKFKIKDPVPYVLIERAVAQLKDESGAG